MVPTISELIDRRHPQISLRVRKITTAVELRTTDASTLSAGTRPPRVRRRPPAQSPPPSTRCGSTPRSRANAQRNHAAEFALAIWGRIDENRHMTRIGHQFHNEVLTHRQAPVAKDAAPVTLPPGAARDSCQSHPTYRRQPR